MEEKYCNAGADSPASFFLKRREGSLPLRDAEERSQVTGIRHFHVYSMDDDTCNWPTDYSVRRSSRATLRSFCFKDSYPFLPLFTGILPTTDAVIVLTQLAKGPRADRSVSEISVLPLHFKMDNLLIGLSFPETRAREVNC